MAKGGFRVAVLGATGQVGRTMLEVLEERKFPAVKLYPLASYAGGRTVSFQGEDVDVLGVQGFDFSEADITLCSVGSEASLERTPNIIAAGCPVVDNSSAFRLDPKAATVVPEINAASMDALEMPLIAACPNCVAIPLAIGLHPLHQALGLRRVDVASYQSVSGAGGAGVRALTDEARALLSGRGEGEDEGFFQAGNSPFDSTIAFNVQPRIGRFNDAGYTDEEQKVIEETRHILGAPDLAINPTCVRVGVFFGHSIAAAVELEEDTTVDQVRELLIAAPGVKVMDNPDHLIYPTPLKVAGEDDVMIGRIRMDMYAKNRINLWIVGDNLRKGAALNSVQIAEHILPRISGNKQ